MKFPQKYKCITTGEHKQLLNILREILAKEKSVVFAYVHGFFIEGSAFNDINVAAFVDDSRLVNETQLFQYQLNLGAKADLAVEGFPVDLRLLNFASLSFRFQVVHNGSLLYCCDDEFRIDFECRTRKLFFDFIPHIKFYYRRAVLGKI